MDRVHTYAALDEVMAADLNAIQDNALGIKQLEGTWIGERPNISCNDSKNILISAYGGLVLGGKVLPGGSGLLTPTVQAGSWSYVYAFGTTNPTGGNALSFEVGSDPPASSLIYKSTDTTRRYVGCFTAFLDAGGTNTVLIPRFTSCNGRYRYRQMVDGILATEILGRSFGAGRGTASQLTSVNAGGAVPPHAKEVCLDAALQKFANNGTVCAFHLRAQDQEIDEYLESLPVTPGVAASQKYLGLIVPYGVVSNNLGVQYYVEHNNTDNSGQPDVLLSLFVTGFLERPWF